MQQKQVVLLCFSYKEGDKCWSFDGEKRMIEWGFRSNYNHRDAGNNLGNYNGKPFVVGGYMPDHAETEILNLADNDLEWKIQQAYPFYPSLRLHATVSVDSQVFVFGGYPLVNRRRVALFSNDSWSNIGTLLEGRYCHNGIQSGNEIILLGGDGPRMTEKWIININSTIQILIEPEVDNYYAYPAMFKVDPNYCLEK